MQTTDAVVSSTLANKWTREEDERLLEGLRIYGEGKWDDIAEKVVKTRDSVKCLQRWEKVLRPGLIKGRWTPEQDALLSELVRQLGRCWLKVAERMNGRTSKQCRERWLNYLDPMVSRNAFTMEEDNLLRQLHSQFGNRWAQIARQLPGRTETSVKLRLKALIPELGDRKTNGDIYRPQVVFNMVPVVSADGVAVVQAVPTILDRSQKTVLYQSDSAAQLSMKAGAKYTVATSHSPPVAPVSPDVPVPSVPTSPEVDAPAEEPKDVPVEPLPAVTTIKVDPSDLEKALAFNTSECAATDSDDIDSFDVMLLGRTPSDDTSAATTVGTIGSGSLKRKFDPVTKSFELRRSIESLCTETAAKTDEEPLKKQPAVRPSVAVTYSPPKSEAKPIGANGPSSRAPPGYGFDPTLGLAGHPMHPHVPPHAAPFGLPPSTLNGPPPPSYGNTGPGVNNGSLNHPLHPYGYDSYPGFGNLPPYGFAYGSGGGGGSTASSSLAFPYFGAYGSQPGYFEQQQFMQQLHLQQQQQQQLNQERFLNRYNVNYPIQSQTPYGFTHPPSSFPGGGVGYGKNNTFESEPSAIAKFCFGLAADPSAIGLKSSETPEFLSMGEFEVKPEEYDDAAAELETLQNSLFPEDF